MLLLTLELYAIYISITTCILLYVTYFLYHYVLKIGHVRFCKVTQIASTRSETENITNSRVNGTGTKSPTGMRLQLDQRYIYKKDTLKLFNGTEDRPVHAYFDTGHIAIFFQVVC